MEISNFRFLELILNSCGGTSYVLVRKSTRAYASMHGRMKKIPVKERKLWVNIEINKLSRYEMKNCYECHKARVWSWFNLQLSSRISKVVSCVSYLHECQKIITLLWIWAAKAKLSFFFSLVLYFNLLKQFGCKRKFAVSVHGTCLNKFIHLCHLKHLSFSRFPSFCTNYNFILWLLLTFFT